MLELCIVVWKWRRSDVCAILGWYRIKPRLLNERICNASCTWVHFALALCRAWRLLAFVRPASGHAQGACAGAVSTDMYADVVSGGADLGSLFDKFVVRSWVPGVGLVVRVIIMFSRASVTFRPWCTLKSVDHAEQCDSHLLPLCDYVSFWGMTRYGCDPQITPEKSVSSQLAYLATASQVRDNGRFVDYNGTTMDW